LVFALVVSGSLTGRPAAAVQEASEPNAAPPRVSLNFDQVDIRAVVKTIGEITGINFVLDDKVTGTVTVMSPTDIPLADAYGVLESILEVHGFAAVPAGSVVKIVPKPDAARQNLPVRVGSDPNQIPVDDTVLTQILPLRYARASEISIVVQSMVSSDVKIAPYGRTNALVVTDTSAKIHYIARVLSQLDVEQSRDQVKTFVLNYASAQVLAEQIGRIMQKAQSVSGSAASRSGTGPLPLSLDPEVRILPDLRTNTLVAIGSPTDLATVADLVRQMDVPRPAGCSDIHVVYLKNATAKEVAQSVTAAMASLKIGGTGDAARPVQVAADEGTNSLIVTASNPDFEAMSQIIEKLDIVREQVLVEMLIAEVSEDTLTQLGVDWATLDAAVEGGIREFATTNLGPRVDFLNGDMEGLAVGAWKKTGSGVSIGAILNALGKSTGVNILSTPHITASNHRKSQIIVGENRPFVNNSRITETTDPVNPTVIKTYEYKDVGITLNITPHVSQGGMVRLEIDSEFTKLITDGTNRSTDTPTTAKRKAQTVVSMRSDSTVVIGGLIRDDKVATEKKVPLVGDLPLLGALFRYKADQVQKTNLLIFITPHVMETQEQMDQITEQKRQQTLAPSAQGAAPAPSKKRSSRDKSR
jgi:general secretion pathway protein D